MAIVFSGKDIVQNERDLTILFQLDSTTSVDWVTAGYTFTFKFVAPSGAVATKTLSAVSGDVYSAKLVGTAGCFTEYGTYRGKLIMTDGVHTVNIGSINFTFEVYPYEVSP